MTGKYESRKLGLQFLIHPVSTINFQLCCGKTSLLTTCEGIHPLQNWLMVREEEDVLKIQMTQNLLV